MIERAIENWLIKTNDRNYQAAFCQTLMHKGHRVIFYSTHRPMEQGKDIVTMDAEGNYCGFQLKTGSIDLTKWREIVGEVKELIELPIVHPSVDKTKLHKSFLVLNGELTDEVRIQIDQINDDNKRKGRNYSHLDVITLGPLLRDFVDAEGEFMPRELEEFQLFLGLLLADGKEFLDKEKLFNFLNTSVFTQGKRSKADLANAVCSSVVIMAYLLNPHQLSENHFALFEGWTCLGACIIRYVKQSGLHREAWESSMALVMEEIVRNLKLLREESISRQNFVEGAAHGDGGLMYKARVTMVLGALTTLELHLKTTSKDKEMDTRVQKVVIHNLSHVSLWGESALPYIFSIVKYLETNSRAVEADGLLANIFEQILKTNSPRQEDGLASPYYSAAEVMEAELGVDEGKLQFKNFSGSSYALRPVIQMLARRKARPLLEKYWRDVSQIHFEWFEPDAAEDFFSWNVREGANRSVSPNQEQSWAELLEESEGNIKPVEFLSKHLELIRFFLLACPHRSNVVSLGLLDI
jgi:hypothetical protein